jgi:hypothetical protein
MRAIRRGVRVAVHDSVFVHHFRFEAGEDPRIAPYRPLLIAAATFADKYLSVADRLYARCWWVPTRLAKYEIAHRIPPRLAYAVRRWLWRRRRDPATGNEWIPPVRVLTE